jgi:hypothetical protein
MRPPAWDDKIGSDPWSATPAPWTPSRRIRAVAAVTIRS